MSEASNTAIRRLWRLLHPCKHSHRDYVAHWITDVGMIKAEKCRSCGTCVIFAP